MKLFTRAFTKTRDDFKNYVRHIFPIISISTVLICSTHNCYAQYAPGKLAVLVVGDGSTALTSVAAPVFVKQFNISGANQSGAVITTLPSTATAGTGSVTRALTQSGSSTSEGSIGLSGNRQYLIVTGYNSSAGLASVSTSVATTFPTNTRVIAKIDASGAADTKTTLNTSYSVSAIRSATSVDGTAYWSAGGNAVAYVPDGNIAAATILAATNTRVASIFNNQLYTSTQSGSVRLATVGSGLPTTTGQTLSNLSGFLTTTGDPYSYTFIDINGGGPDLLYLASLNTAPAGLLKYRSADNGATWTAAGSLTGNPFGVTGYLNTCTANVDLYITLSASGGTKPTTLYKFSDNNAVASTLSGAISSSTLLATAAVNTAFGGVAFTPGTTFTDPAVYNVTGGNGCTIPGLTIGLSNSETGVSYQLFIGASAVGSSVTGTGAAISFGSKTIAGTYKVIATNLFTGCTTTMNGTSVIYSSPVVSFSGLAVSYCLNPATITLTGSPAGGFFSGPGINGNSFDPSVAGIGVKTITYTYTDNNGCSNATSQNATITALPIVSFSGLAASYCVNASAVTLTGSPLGGIFSGPGISGNTFDPVAAGIGIKTIMYSYTGVNGCSNVTSQVVTITGLPTGSNYVNTTLVCGANITITPTVAPANAASNVAITNSNFTGLFSVNPVTGVITVTNAKPAGTYLVTVMASDICSNTASSSFTLTVTDPLCSGGSFADAVNLSNGINAQSIAIGDFNQDGKQDIVTGSYDNINGGLTNILLGDGSGGFSSRTLIYQPILDPSQVVIGEFNGDGKQDLAIRCNSALLIYLGDGMGGFSYHSNMNLELGFIASIAIADFNGDGKQDIAYISDGGLYILLGNGAGDFNNLGQKDHLGGIFSIATGDFNGDGKLDIAAASYYLSKVYIRLGDGLGGFNAYNDVIVGDSPWSVSIGDFNRDGKQDLAIPNSGSNTISIRLGNGLGDFIAAYDVSAGTTPHSVSIGDLNGDGKQDFAVANYGSTMVSIRLGDGLGGFSVANDIPVGTNPFLIAIGDLNGDGKQDFAVANNGSNTISICLAVTNDINVKGNTVSIADGDITPSANDYTDFGNVCIFGNMVKTYTIENTGTTALQLNNGVINVTGADAAMFTASDITLPVTIAPGSSVTFTVTFAPTSTGTKSATIHIASDDCDEADYDFAVAATVNPLPIVNFSGLPASICPNASAISLTGSPSGGTFSGPGISGNTFDPAIAGAGGPYTITYSYTNVDGCSNSISKQVIVTCEITLNLKLYLQGYYIGSNIMQPVLYNQLVPSSTLSEADTIIIELHDPATYALVNSKKAVLQINGIATATLTSPPGNYYIAIRHRNSIQTWSAAPVQCVASTPLYDFTTAANKAMGDNQVQVQTGKWAFYTGDLNQDDFIDGNDFPAFDTDSFNGVSSEYVATDMNGDGFVDGNDFPVFDANSFNGVTSIHP